MLTLSRLLVCLAVLTSLWGCAPQYVIIPSASGLPTSAQVEAEKRRYAIPPDLRARLDAVLAKSGSLAENGGAHRRFVGQMLDPRAMLQRDLLAAVLEWAAEKPADERLTLQTRQIQAVPRYEVVQPDATEKDPSTLRDPKVDFGAGAAAGAAIAGVPLGPFAADVAIELNVLPNGTYWGRVGRTCGEFVSGVGQMIVGCAGMSGGVGASGTGGGSIVGVPLVAASYALALNGASSAAHAMSEAGQLWREGPPPDVDPAPQPEIKLLQKSKPAAKQAPTQTTATPARPAPTPQAAPAKPAPAKPAAPIETQTTTFDRSTGVTTTTKASGTTTETRPRVKGKPSGDATKDVAKGAKRGPKTDPDAPHNAAVRKEAEKLKAEGNEIFAGGRVRKEQLIDTKGGKKDGRRPDIIYGKPGETPRGRNVGKTNADGTPVKREREALDDLNKHSDTPTDFVPYDR